MINKAKVSFYPSVLKNLILKPSINLKNKLIGKDLYRNKKKKTKTKKQSFKTITLRCYICYH